MEEQKQPLTQTTTAPAFQAPAPANPTPCTVAEILPPTATVLQSQQASNPPVGSNLAYNTNQCTMVAASCAGCVQFQQQCQQQSHEAMEMTAILHSQPPLQLVSCHGPIMHPSTPSNQRSSYQSHQVPALPLTSSTQCNDMPEYSNLPQPRQQASIASAAAAVAAQAAAQAGNSSTSFNSKRSRHSSLWSLEDEQELLEQDHSNTSDRVNYVNDPFGHTSEFASTPAGIQMMRQQQLNDEMESQMRSSFQNNSSSNSKPRHSATGSAASSEAF